MSDSFFCWGCNKHKPATLLSETKSSSGKDWCTSCSARHLKRVANSPKSSGALRKKRSRRNEISRVIESTISFVKQKESS